MMPNEPRALPWLLTFNGGYVDAAGFLAIQGLFTAHVTGNFVTIGATLVSGTNVVLTKLLALPVFCIAVLVCRLLGFRWERQDHAPLPRLLAVHLALLAAGCGLALLLLPVRAADEWASLPPGLLLVAAMGAQNELHRVHLPGSLPSTIMTSTTTQLMVEVAEMLRDASPEVRRRVRSMALQVAVFAAGCGFAALAYDRVGPWCFLLPPFVAIAALVTAARQGGGGTPPSH